MGKDLPVLRLLSSISYDASWVTAWASVGIKLLPAYDLIQEIAHFSQLGMNTGFATSTVIASFVISLSLALTESTCEVVAIEALQGLVD